MNNDKELMQMALDALRLCTALPTWPSITPVIEALRARLSQCERCGEVNSAEIHTCTPQEPVAWTVQGLITDFSRDFSAYQTKTYTVPLYTAPPQRERIVFPTMLRKMWSGTEVQAWLDENVNKEKNT